MRAGFGRRVGNNVVVLRNMRLTISLTLCSCHVTWLRRLTSPWRAYWTSTALRQTLCSLRSCMSLSRRSRKVGVVWEYVPAPLTGRRGEDLDRDGQGV
jgi:hypothetical protein